MPSLAERLSHSQVSPHILSPILKFSTPTQPSCLQMIPTPWSSHKTTYDPTTSFYDLRPPTPVPPINHLPREADFSVPNPRGEDSAAKTLYNIYSAAPIQDHAPGIPVRCSLFMYPPRRRLCIIYIPPPAFSICKKGASYLAKPFV